MIELWDVLPEEFRLPDPEALVTVWRGDKLGKIATGMACRLVDSDPVDNVLQVALKGRRALIELVDKYTSAWEESPLVSVAADIRLAQFFTGFRGRDETIYELSIPAHRLMRDPENIGTPRWPKDSELFVVGRVEPSDIVRVKTNNNDDSASELLFMEDGQSYIANFFTDIRTIPVPTLPNPNGKWIDVR